MKNDPAGLAALDKAIELQPMNPHSIAWRGRILVELGRVPESLADFSLVDTLLGADGGSAYLVATGYAALSRTAETTMWLRKAFQRDRELVSSVAGDEDFHAIRAEPEFQALLAEFNNAASDETSDGTN